MKTTCTLKELYEHCKKIGKENYKIYVQCSDINGNYTEAEIKLENIEFKEKEQKMVI